MLLTENVKTKLQKFMSLSCPARSVGKAWGSFGHEFETHVGRHFIVFFAKSLATYNVEHTISIKMKNLVLAHSINTQRSNKHKKRQKKQNLKQNFVFKYFRQLRAKPVLDVKCLRTNSPTNTICWHSILYYTFKTYGQLTIFCWFSFTIEISIKI